MAVGLCVSSCKERSQYGWLWHTGLTFTDGTGHQVAEWKTRLLVSEPQDDFVLAPRARIAFDMDASINGNSSENRWVIELPVGVYQVHYAYHVDRETDWYDFLAKLCASPL